ncbi:MAG: group II intron maturase-specific domain-containing protein [Lachnoclostridium sp.]|nr:group II intron maturase-specific domain-containing protein [Lachnoclostridium sp.]
MPLFVDPMLIFNSNKPEYKALHEEIIKFFHFLYKKAEKGLTKKEIGAWFNFKEVPNNWLGYSLEGNKGLALGQKYAEFLYNNIAFAINTNGLTQSGHIEKIMLLYEGSGKDKISDLTVNLIKGYLCEYTEKFAMEYIDSKYFKRLPVEKAYFNYETESFVSKEYTLPYIYNEKGKIEYVLLTPYDILREDDPAINRKDFIDSYDSVRMTIENDALRAYVNNYLSKVVREYEEKQKKNKKKVSERSIAKIEKQAFMELVKEYPELYDYYIKCKEKNADCVSHISKVKYLGYSFYNYRGKCRFRVHPKSVTKMKSRIRELTNRSNGWGNEYRALKLTQFIRGWVNYFGMADMKKLLKETDEWLRHKIRAIYWKQWKKVRTKYRELKKLGVDKEKAWICANMRNGNWYCSGYFVLQTAFNNKKLRELGYPTFTEFYLKTCEN